MTLVTVITVCKNAEKTIAKTIESVYAQTYPHIEYLIIDGRSSDNTVNIIQSYEQKFQGRLQWVSEPDEGIYDAMNKGINMAHGAVIGIINSDDWYESNAVEMVINAYSEHRDVVYYGILRVIEDGKEIMLKSINHHYLHRDVVGHPAYFVSKLIYQKHGLYRLDYKIASDYELMMRLVSLQVPFIQINSILANYNQGGYSSKYGTTTSNEQIKIRYEYGYISKKKMYFQMVKNFIGYILRKLNDFL